MDNEILLAIVGVGVYGLCCLYFMTYMVYIWFYPKGTWETFHAFPQKGVLVKTAAALMIGLTIPCCFVMIQLMSP